MSSDDRLRRLLALVPWVAARDGPPLSEVCARFDCRESELLEDLELLFLCGIHPYTPDALIDVDIAGGRVWIRYADYFSRPLRLTPEEAVALLAAGHALLSVPGADPDGPLARGLKKLAGVLGTDAAHAVEVALAPTAHPVMEALRSATAGHRQVEIEYYAFGRDQWTRRVVDPYALFAAGGHWYVSAYCHAVGDERLFRADRIRQATVLGSEFEPPTKAPELTVYEPRGEDQRIVLDLSPAARWVIEQYPHEGVEEREDGGVRVRLAISERPWLERLLLRLGRHASVVEGDAEVGRSAACRLLGRYRRTEAPVS